MICPRIGLLLCTSQILLGHKYAFFAKSETGTEDPFDFGFQRALALQMVSHCWGSFPGAILCPYLILPVYLPSFPLIPGFIRRVNTHIFLLNSPPTAITAPLHLTLKQTRSRQPMAAKYDRRIRTEVCLYHLTRAGTHNPLIIQSLRYTPALRSLVHPNGLFGFIIVPMTLCCTL